MVAGFEGADEVVLALALSLDLAPLSADLVPLSLEPLPESPELVELAELLPLLEPLDSCLLSRQSPQLRHSTFNLSPMR